MFTSKFPRLIHVVGVAYGVVYTIHKTNIELVKFVANEFAPARNKEEAKTFGDALDEIKDGLTDGEKTAVDEAFNDEFVELWKSFKNGDLTETTEY